MASGLGLRCLFSITRGGTRGVSVARTMLTSRSRCNNAGCHQAVEIKPSMLLYPYAPICGKAAHIHHFCTAPAEYSNECKVQIVGDGRELHVVWPREDGMEESSYHATWLKHSCHCPLCWEKTAKQHLVWDKEPDPSGITISRATPTGPVEAGELDIIWKFAREGEEHRGSIPLKWLQENSYSPEALKRRREATTPSLATSLPTASYSEAKKDDKYLWKWLKVVNVYGICLLTDVSTDLETVMQAADLAGGILDTNYEKVFNVIPMENPINVAFTNSKLPMHFDLCYYESQPGLQLLHCIRNDHCVVGGENILLDMWAVAEQFRREHPKHFETLTRVRATFQRIHFNRKHPESFKRDRPHFILDANGDLTAFYWNEALQGSLSASADEVDAYFEARYCLKTALANSPFKLTHRLQPGEALVLNNRRVMHSRTSYVLNGGERHLQGSYVGIDDFMSKVRMLAMRYEPDFQPKRSFGLDPM